MNTNKKLSKLTCEQVYEIWRSDPHLIEILDTRENVESNGRFIPGAKTLKKQELPFVLNNLQEKLAIILVDEADESALHHKVSTYDNVVFMADCNRWSKLNYPIAGQGIKKAIFDLYLESLEEGVDMKSDIIFHQLFEPQSCSYTYIIADKATKEAAIIDPVLETVDRDLKLIEELGLNLVYILDTHIHADHITGAGELRKRTNAKTALSHQAKVTCVDIPLEDGQELSLGNKKIRVIATPGHTDTCMTFAFEGRIFTGDTLLIRGCGRTDFQQGSADLLFDSVRNKLFYLPDETMIYPGHDYRGLTSSTIGAEKKHNPRLKDTITKEEFKTIMSELNLANPKKIHQAVPANLECGQTKDGRVLHPQIVDGIPEVSVEDLFSKMAEVRSGRLRLIDVRRPEEFNNELAHIEGSELVTLGPQLSQLLAQGDRNQEIVFICRSGGRSGTATAESINLGYKYTANMVGGMIRWNENKLPTVRSENNRR